MKTVSDEYIAKEEAHIRKPVELYHFWPSISGTHYRYTSGDVEVTISGTGSNAGTYSPATIDREQTQYTTDLEVSTLIINAGYIEDPMLEYIAINPIEVYWVEVLKLFRDQEEQELTTVFVGQITNVIFQGNATKIHCVGFEKLLTNPIPKYRYQPGCNHTLYDTKCSIDKTSYDINATLSSVSSDGLTLISSSFNTGGAQYFTEGYVSWQGNKRKIMSHVTNTITIQYKISDLAASDIVTVYPGCNKSITTCKNKFNNVDNFLGFPYIPLDNPAVWA